MLCLVANLLTWAAFPPLEWFPLAWFAPAAWASLIQSKHMPGKRPYWTIWFVSASTWAFLLEGVGRAFWANYFGLVFLGAYLALYQVLTVALARVAVHRWNIPTVIAAPAVWTGLELVRGHLITGFSMALLGHTQVKASAIIQIADLFGAYGVSFVVVFVGSCIASSLHSKNIRQRVAPLITAGAVLLCVFVYGLSSIASLRQIPVKHDLKVALIQGTEDTVFDPATAQQRAVDTFNQYWRLSLDACGEHDDLDLIVWPEGMFSGNVPQLIVATDATIPAGLGMDSKQFEMLVEQRLRYFNEKTEGVASVVNRNRDTTGSVDHRTYLLVGCDTLELVRDGEQTYNAALLIDPSGKVVARYDKNHRVLLGEYVPFGDYFPWLYDFVPIGRGLTPGTRPASFEMHGISVAPSICFEDTVPHLIRRQVCELTRKGHRPDVLVNLTNDGWFWGSGVLDLQLSCAIFRAIEMRRPMLIAANTGLTASIDSNGSVIATMPRRKEGTVVSNVVIRERSSSYEWYGDWFAWLCLLFCLGLGLATCWDRAKRPGITLEASHE
ncbi:MAG: apolipoprotein N-acyltransferase [Planctomycetales bacterium]|nr:apolipoprotein N-acyltransferase [Planctomycetales bacterium]